MHAALVALAFVLLAAANPAAASADDGSSQGQHHVWYIAAEETVWDYAPGGKNLCFRHQKGHSHDDEEHQDTDDTEDLLWVNKGLGRFLKKAVYVQYTNDSFQVRAVATPMSVTPPASQRPARFYCLATPQTASTVSLKGSQYLCRKSSLSLRSSTILES